MEQRHADFQEHYRDLPTEELLRIRLTTDLVPEARLALDAELDRRSEEIAANPPEVYVGPTTKPKPRFLNLWLGIAISLAIASFPFLLPYWSRFLDWLAR